MTNEFLQNPVLQVFRIHLLWDHYSSPSFSVESHRIYIVHSKDHWRGPARRFHVHGFLKSLWWGSPLFASAEIRCIIPFWSDPAHLNRKLCFKRDKSYIRCALGQTFESALLHLVHERHFSSALVRVSLGSDLRVILGLAMLDFIKRLSSEFRDPYTLKALYV
jgi:hypothetical protein